MTLQSSVFVRGDLKLQCASYILKDDVICHQGGRAYKKSCCNIRSPLMKTLDWSVSVETFDCECILLGFTFILIRPEQHVKHE